MEKPNIDCQSAEIETDGCQLYGSPRCSNCPNFMSNKKVKKLLNMVKFE